eukprot:jgi/Mesvir1/15603/Mv03212-RA.1
MATSTSPRLSWILGSIFVCFLRLGAAFEDAFRTSPSRKLLEADSTLDPGPPSDNPAQILTSSSTQEVGDGGDNLSEGSVIGILVGSGVGLILACSALVYALVLRHRKAGEKQIKELNTIGPQSPGTAPVNVTAPSRTMPSMPVFNASYVT